MTRTFIAVELDAAVRAALERVIARLRRAAPEVRWADPAGLHLTLAFLGEQDDERLTAAHEATAAAARLGHPFYIEVGQPGYFGPKWAPRVIWAGVGGETAKLTAVQETLARELERRGFAREDRPFAPHLTLARLKERVSPQTLGALLREVETPAWRTSGEGGMRVERLSVMKSELARPAAIYTCLAEYEMGKGAESGEHEGYGEEQRNTGKN
ncbi:MAG TPA: RNA 2',3'-cyclic phosphodiesterase [Ktedonobacterales bacterium]|nr:RNA 2',3'-cyclic phosphodiesterase [Ktedonobacterales bacterium]